MLLTGFAALLVSLWTVGLASAVSGNQNKTDLFLVTLLPDDRFHLPSLDKVRPAVFFAAAKVNRSELLPGFRIRLDFRDSRCSNVYAPHSAVEVYKHNQVHAFFGPSCDFALGKFSIFTRPQFVQC